MEMSTVSDSFARDVLHHSAKLKPFARKLTRSNSQLADDLVQETILRALLHRDQSQLGTNLGAWLATILRNAFFNEARRQRHFPTLDDETPQKPDLGDAAPFWRVSINEFSVCFSKLSDEHREAVNLVGVRGFSYEAAAYQAGCAIGTMKSRVSRARAELRRMRDATTLMMPAI